MKGCPGEGGGGGGEEWVATWQGKRGTSFLNAGWTKGERTTGRNLVSHRVDNGECRLRKETDERGSNGGEGDGDGVNNGKVGACTHTPPETRPRGRTRLTLTSGIVTLMR